jgi:hypothetical protein
VESFLIGQRRIIRKQEDGFGELKTSSTPYSPAYSLDTVCPNAAQADACVERNQMKKLLLIPVFMAAVMIVSSTLPASAHCHHYRHYHHHYRCGW